MCSSDLGDPFLHGRRGVTLLSVLGRYSATRVIMDGWMDEWMGGWMDGWIDGWISGWMDG